MNKMILNNNKKEIIVNKQKIDILIINDKEYISLTDLARYVDLDNPRYPIQNWMRNIDVISYLGLWEELNNGEFKGVEFDTFKDKAGNKNFKITPQKWIKETNAIGIISKSGRYDGGTYAISDIAFEFASWLSPEFKLYVIQEFQRLKKNEALQNNIEWHANTLIEQKYYNDMTVRHDKEIKLLQESFNKLEEKKKITEIYFNGQIYDAYSKIYEIFNEAKKELVIIDGYADNTLLDIIKRLKIKVTIITKSNNLLTKQDIEKYNKQYNNLKVIYNNTYHDRYFILDNSIVYHCGSSINRIGYKTFSITLISDDNIKNTLINNIKY